MICSGGIQAQLDAAFATVGALFGGTYVQYRPSGTANPLATPLRTITAGFDTTPLLKFRAPAKYDQHDLYYAAADTSLLQIGDYLVGQIGTLFVAAIEPVKPALCVRCNRVITAMRPDANVTASPPVYGRQASYSGASSAHLAMLFEGWPVSLMEGPKGELGANRLPDDSRIPSMELLLPSVAGVTLRVNDQITDDLGERYTISTHELTVRGWRSTARQTVA